MVALPSDVARSDKKVKSAFETAVKAMVSMLRRDVWNKKMPTEDAAMAVAALCAGGMVVARSLNDKEFADRLREAATQAAVVLGRLEERRWEADGPKRSAPGLKRAGAYNEGGMKPRNVPVPAFAPVAFAFLALAFSALAFQGPAINPGGVVNAASYTAPVAPGSIAAIFGTFPLSTDFSAQTLPLPNSLGGLSFEFDSANKIALQTASAPLFFASPLQVNMQIPWELSAGAQTTLAGEGGAAQSLSIAAYAPGIFTINGEGNGAGLIQDNSYRLISTVNPAQPGVTTIVVYATGLGPVNNPPADGAPSPSSPLAQTTTLPIVTIGGAQATVYFSGLAPGYVGVYQINAQVPAAAPMGDAVPLQLSIGGVTSNTVTIVLEPPTPDQRADTMIAQMTQAQELQLVMGGETATSTNVPQGGAGWVPGIPSLGIPNLDLADGSVGVGNGVGPATALPSSIASAASWDTNEAYKYGQVIGSELRAYGMNVNLGGNINLIGREPRDGRTFETKGEDPILAGKIAAAHISAIQDQYVMGCIKHYAFNDQETGRGTANAEIDERSARESDLLAFEIGIAESNVQSVMCAYNLINGTYSCENPHFLNDILKGDWAFPGFVMSDWGATHSTVNAANAGLDQEQPDNSWFQNLGAAVTSGAVPQSRLGDMVHRILRAEYAAGIIDHPATIQPINAAADLAVAQEMEEQGAVLLKNTPGLLPLTPNVSQLIAVIGSNANIAVISGGGSAQVWPIGGPALTSGNPCPPCWSTVVWDPSSPMNAIASLAGTGSYVSYNDGTNAQSAAAIAAVAKTAIVFVSQWTSEGMDLPSLNFTDFTNPTPIDQDALVSAVAAVNPRTIVVMENGGAQVMPWLSQVGAVLEAWFPGQMGGPAIANLLFGNVNPSGKLPITFPASVNDLPRPVVPTPPDGYTPFPVDYTEGLNVGYKWYDSQGLTPLFPFGFGLSYTTFSFTNTSLANNLDLPNPNFQVSFTLTNTGAMAGAEVAQVYLSPPPGIGEPPKRLVGWQKVLLQPGASQQVTIEVDANDVSQPMSYWDMNSNGWLIAPGTYIVYLGNSSAMSSLTAVGTLTVGS
jgi:beta-glucosidase